MEESVWSFKNVTLRNRKYLVLLVRHNDFPEPVSAELERHADKFGEFMRAKGALIVPYPHRSRDALDEVLAKDWPSEIKEKMEATQFPFFVVVDQDYEVFSPKTHRSALIWFEDFEQKPIEIWKVLDSVAKKIYHDEDLFGYLEDIDTKARRAQLAKGAEAPARWVDLTLPIVPGFVSINASAIWADLMKKLQ